ncbi:MAG: hypothetical protein KDD62_12485 [Bdellovibrionales bacterium]|nr:hypothetical protein [Bdellovibrionales bacterium]
MRRAQRFDQAGFTLMDIIVSVGISAMVFGYAAQSLTTTTTQSFDSEVIITTEERARSILDLMLFDLRMLGAGIPFDQEGFSMSGSGTSSVALPILTDSTSSYIHFRVNELGKDTLITSAFAPSGASSSFTVYSTEDLLEDDIIYLSDATTGGSDGLQGQISAISGLTVTLSSGFVYSDSANFPVGSVLNRVTTVEYSSPDDDSGIVRNNGLGDIVISPNSYFSISYKDQDGNALSLPLSESDIEDYLAIIDISVTVNSDRKLKDGTTYTAQADSKVTVRGL